MERRQRQVPPAELAGLKNRIGQWRTSRSARRPMPEELWDEAVRLARTHGVSPVATPLRLNFYGLKKRLEAVSEVREPIRPKSDRPKFIELSPAVKVVPPSGCVVEVEGAGGTRMTIRLGNGSGAEIAALVGAFLGRRG